MPTALRGVILDVDGTLVDSNDAHAEAWARILAESGYNVPAERLRPLIGMGSDKFLQTAIGLDKDSPEGQRLSERRTALFAREYLPRLRPTRGAATLLQHLRSEGLHLVVASSAEGDELKALLDACGASDLISDTAPGKEAAPAKPDPDIVQVALRKLGVPPVQAVMLGDTPYDVQAATKAGVLCIALRSGGWSDAQLTGAAAIYDDPADLLSHVDQSPLRLREQE